ncbi:molybdate ABC transporter substrate-binding protein [Sedimenticola sp.]|uniref:molybdate ABC transporter substrate-binding protein n=1 Tax=Sedimenticola sp. TaxID=1940285 RepID=UPI00258E9324|nr:molybdate ABC transporter substrate-binding protein [Sedimenticola sp.]MCW8903003.1 molybdate ABC transporter substrate-binding protein [Sedimenticola sp.]
MKKTTWKHLLAISCLALPIINSAMADEINIAVASNFADPIKELTGRFEERTGHRINLVLGSTGKHYAQIKNGAPFAAFFAADARRPELLEKEGVALPGSRFTYAVGRIVLWSPRKGYVDSQGELLEHKPFHHLAIANPRLAPYGKAAQQFLQARGLWEGLQGRMVRGENIGQTFQFVRSGSAELGIVAYSQVKRPGHPLEGSLWEIPPTEYAPIEQQAVLLKENPVAREFMAFIKSPEAIDIILGFGYAIP